MDSQRILVVDDDPTLRELIALGLRRSGFEVSCAEDGHDALHQLAGPPPDAIVADLMMPGMDGIELCTTIRDTPALARVPVVVLSARAFAADRAAARRAGADAYIQKPLDVDHLVSTLRRLIADELQLRFWGVRGTFPVPSPHTVRYGGNTSCTSLTLPRGEHLVFDAGTGIRALGEHLGTQPGPHSGAILLSHPHWDHIQALPFFAPLYTAGNRFQVCGPAQPGSGVRDLVAAQMDSRFLPVTPRDFAADVTYTDLRQGRFRILGLEVSTSLLMHPGTCLGYRVQYKGRSIAYVTDHELSAPAFPDYSRAYVERLSQFLGGVDVLITDTTYSDAEYPSQVRGGHSSVSQVADLAHRAQVRDLYMVHHAPSQTDADIDAKLEHAAALLASWGSSVRPHVPAEGDLLRL